MSSLTSTTLQDIARHTHTSIQLQLSPKPCRPITYTYICSTSFPVLPSSTIDQHLSLHSFIRCGAMPRRDRREERDRERSAERERSPVATRTKATPPSRPDRWTNPNSRAEASDHRNKPFNVFSQSTESHRFRPSHTDDSDTRNKVALRSNSETRRHHSDLTAWRNLTVPTPDPQQQNPAEHIPAWARQPTQDIALPSSSSHTTPSQFQSIAPQGQVPTPPLSILFRQNGDQIIHVHGAPPDQEKKWYLDVIRTIDPTHTLNPFRLPDTQPANRPHSIADLDRSLPRQAPPVLQLPGPAHSFSDSTDTEQPRLTTTPSGTAHYEVRVRADGTTIVGTDTHQIQVRFLTDRETKHIRLPKSSTWVPWAKMSVIEFKHHQSHEPGLQNIWCPAPYCWLLCSQFLQACKQKSKEDFWFLLWHFLDKIKENANRATNRLVAAHELSLRFAVHHHLSSDSRCMPKSFGKMDILTFPLGSIQLGKLGSSHSFDPPSC